ncbi:hypothetical protein LXA43DRAFT_1101540 [Ganoderma leucocontextum]|nr:hypothetical protein LXA43DRAFT_1101540 [Ganoderma leucocontextum]
MAIHSASNVLEEVSRIAAHVLPRLDERIDGLIIAFEALTAAEVYDQDTAYLKLRMLAFDLHLRIILSSRSEQRVIDWVCRVNEVCGQLDDNGCLAAYYEEEYQRLRNKHLVPAYALRVARAEDARYVALSLRSALYRAGLGDPSILARADHAADWTAGELCTARSNEEDLTAYLVDRRTYAALNIAQELAGDLVEDAGE